MEARTRKSRKEKKTETEQEGRKNDENTTASERFPPLFTLESSQVVPHCIVPIPRGCVRRGPSFPIRKGAGMDDMVIGTLHEE